MSNFCKLNPFFRIEKIETMTAIGIDFSIISGSFEKFDKIRKINSDFLSHVVVSQEVHDRFVKKKTRETLILSDDRRVIFHKKILCN